MTDKHVNEKDGWVYKGSMLKHELYGPGSKLLKGGNILYEGIWKSDRMVGKGYLISLGDRGEIVTVMECKDGSPWTSIKLLIEDKEPKRQSLGPQRKEAGTGEHIVNDPTESIDEPSKKPSEDAAPIGQAVE